MVEIDAGGNIEITAIYGIRNVHYMLSECLSEFIIHTKSQTKVKFSAMIMKEISTNLECSEQLYIAHYSTTI